MRGALPRAGLVFGLLLGVDFFDELASGIPSVAAPDIQQGFGVSYGQAAGWTLAAFGALSLILEPPIFLLSDRYPRRFFVAGGLLATAAACALAAWSPSYWIFLLALLLYGPSSGAFCGVAQATLMDARPDERERTMTRWTFAGAMGDLATPAFIAVLAFLGFGWRTAFGAVAVMGALYAALLWRIPYPEPIAREASTDRSDGPKRVAGKDEDEGLSLLDSVRLLKRHPRLLAWGVGTLLVDLMDEILVAFGTLYMRDVQGLDVGDRAVALTILILGEALGLVVCDRILSRVRPTVLLGWAAVVTALSWTGWLFSGGGALGSALLFLVGFTASCHYPIAKAQAYRALPHRSGAVNAALVVFGPLGLAAPIVLAFVADGFGLRVALSLLLLQPLGLVALVLATARHRSPVAR